MPNRVFFLYPNTANSPNICNAISIFAGIAKKFSWQAEYFDTYLYEKDQDSMQDRESSGEFRFSERITKSKFKPKNSLVPELQNRIDIFKPDIIVISCISFEYEFLLSFFSRIHIPSQSIVVIGGIHSTLEPDRVIGTGLFDLVCAGEGEAAFAEILKKFEKKESLRNISNTYFFEKLNGRVIKNPRMKLLNEKDLWKNTPEYSFFKNDYYLYPFDGKLYRRLNFEFARGCPYSCAYCGNTALRKANEGLGKFVRTRPIKSIKRDLKKVVADYNIELLYFQDECFLSHSTDWLLKLAQWYGREIKKPFIAQTRPESVDREKIDILKKMNSPFFQISIGVESGSEKILFNICNRKTKIKRIVEAFELLNKNKIRNCAFFMIGFPFETREDIFKTIQLCRLIQPTVFVVSIFQPLPGQTLRQECIKKGYIKGDEALPTFTDGSILKMPQISQKEILNLRRCFPLYAILPESYYPQIEQCEKKYTKNSKLYKKLVALRWNIKQ